MQRAFRTLVLIGLFSCSAGPLALDAQSPDGPAKKTRRAEASAADVVTLTASIPGKTPAGEHIPLTLELRNIGKQRVVFGDAVFDTFALEVKTKEGTVVPQTYWGRWQHKTGKEARKVLIELDPGKTAAVTFDLDRLFDLSGFGEYTLRVQARVRAGKEPRSVVVERLAFEVGLTPFPRIKAD